MRHKRLTGVTVFSVICLIMSVPALIVYLITVLVTFPDFLKQSASDIIILVIIPIGLTILLLLTAIGLLRSKEWGRRFALFFSLLWLLSNTATLFVTLIGSILGKVYARYPYILFVWYFVFATLSAASFYFSRYFSRPQVKEQFK